MIVIIKLKISTIWLLGKFKLGHRILLNLRIIVGSHRFKNAPHNGLRSEINFEAQVKPCDDYDFNKLIKIIKRMRNHSSTKMTPHDG